MSEGMLKIRAKMMIIGVILICLGTVFVGVWTNFAYPGDIERLHNVLIGSVIGFSFPVFVTYQYMKAAGDQDEN